MLLPEISVSRVSNAAAAAQTDINGTAVDMQGWEGVTFVAALGDVTATSVLSMKAQQGAASNGSDGVDVTGSATNAFTAGASDADNKLLVVDVVNPTSRYVRPVLSRGTANAVVDGIIAIRYRGRKVPATADSTVLAQKAVAAN